MKFQILLCSILVICANGQQNDTLIDDYNSEDTNHSTTELNIIDVTKQETRFTTVATTIVTPNEVDDDDDSSKNSPPQELVEIEQKIKDLNEIVMQNNFTNNEATKTLRNHMERKFNELNLNLHDKLDKAEFEVKHKELNNKISVLQTVICLFMVIGICATVYFLFKLYSKQNGEYTLKKGQNIEENANGDLSELRESSKIKPANSRRQTVAITSELKSKPPKLNSFKPKSSESLTIKFSDVKEVDEDESEQEEVNQKAGHMIDTVVEVHNTTADADIKENDPNSTHGEELTADEAEEKDDPTGEDSDEKTFNQEATEETGSDEKSNKEQSSDEGKQEEKSGEV